MPTVTPMTAILMTTMTLPMKTVRMGLAPTMMRISMKLEPLMVEQTQSTTGTLLMGTILTMVANRDRTQDTSRRQRRRVLWHIERSL